MNLKRAVFLLPMLLLAFAAPGYAQVFDPFAQAEQGPTVRAQLIADTTAIEPGRPFRVGVLFTMDPDWHIYGRNPGDVGYATGIDWDLPEGFTVGALQWPTPERIEQDGLVSYGYHEQVLLFATVTPPENIAADRGTVSLKAHTAWLACKEACIPGEQAVELEMKVGRPLASDEAALFDRFAALVPSRLSDGESHSLAWYLLLALLGGVILNIMPCVLPVVSLKVLSFVKQAGESRARVLEMGVAFTAGVLVSFLALAGVVVALKLAGAQVGWGFQFQEPRFVIAMAAVVLVFGLSLFGVFEINLPGRAATKMDAASGRGGLVGAFFNGVLATALATPCTAPLLGPALGFAFNQPPAVIVLFFLMIGLGLSLPYLLLSMNPAWLRFMPRPGAWMERFKQSMGFLLMATLVWLLWVLGGQIGNDGLARAMAFLLGLALACWMISLGWDFQSSARRRWTLTLLAVVIAAGAYTFPASYLAGQTEARDGAIDWQPFSPGRVDDLVAEGRIVFLDFTADWCLTCKFNEKTVLASKRVHRAFEEYDVALVKADWTQRDAVIGAELEKYGRSGVPLYVILAPGGASQPIVLDTFPTAGEIEKGLAQAAGLNP